MEGPQGIGSYFGGLATLAIGVVTGLLWTGRRAAKLDAEVEALKAQTSVLFEHVGVLQRGQALTDQKAAALEARVLATLESIQERLGDIQTQLRSKL